LAASRNQTQKTTVSHFRVILKNVSQPSNWLPKRKPPPPILSLSPSLAEQLGRLLGKHPASPEAVFNGEALLDENAMVQSLMVSVMPHFEDREVSVFDLYYP
jgi:hypothetical protein